MSAPSGSGKTCGEEMQEKQDIEAKIQSVRKQLAGLDEKRSVLISLLEKLQTQLDESRTPARVAESHEIYVSHGPSNDDVDVFMKLFSGRKDVFPKRWENRKGRSGYSPACRNEWVRGVCGKPKVKCGKCESREFLPVTPEVIRTHLTGEMVIGVYPLLKDETCRFLAVDFDERDWMNDVSAFLETCSKKDVDCAVERSRSGNGAHVWFFFEDPISARLARRFGCALLTETMERRHQVGLGSYDRLFPSQDTMMKDGFGNLIALPLQAGPAEEGNSLFVDPRWEPYPDQWAFLRSVKLLPELLVQSIEENAARRGIVVGVRMALDDEMSDRPWMIPPSGRRKYPAIRGTLPAEVHIVRSNFIYVEKQGLPSGLINRVIRLAAFQNPKFYEAQAMRRSTFGNPRVISCAEEMEKHIAVPRGCFEELSALLDDLGINASCEDKRSVGKRIRVRFDGALTPDQEESLSKLMADDIGVLVAPTAFGKTVVGAKLIAERKVNTLVVVYTRQLLAQWRARMAMFLGMDEKGIGQIGGGKKNPTGKIDVATIQSLCRKGVVDDLVAEYGHLVVDECHHISAISFELVLRQVKARYVTGLTATPTRKDGHHPIIFMQCGPIRWRMSPKKAARERGFEHRGVVRKTNTTIDIPEDQTKIHDVYDAILNDVQRTAMVAEDVRSSVREGRSPLILTERRNHLDSLAEELADFGDNLYVLHGGLREKNRREVMGRFEEAPEGGQRVLLATGKYIGEGFDDSRLDTLFLTSPVSWKGILQQYAGRLHRAHHAKREVVIYDYVDHQIPMARRMFQRRKKGYAALGYSIEDPAQGALAFE